MEDDDGRSCILYYRGNCNTFKISKLTVYDLIKKGELLSYRVGKQIRVDATDLEAYKQRSKSKPHYQERVHAIEHRLPTASYESNHIVITGQDISLDILSKHLENYDHSSLRPLRSFAGSLDSLIAMLRTPQRMKWLEHVLQVLRSDDFRKELGAIQGYDLS